MPRLRSQGREEEEVNNGAGSSSENTLVENALTLSSLPEELLRMILSKLENHRDLNSCRAVSRHWNTIAIQVGVQNSIALWKPWYPSERSFHRSLSRTPSPILKLASSFERAYFPVGFNKFVGKSNPFRTNSLCLKSFGPSERQPVPYQEGGTTARQPKPKRGGRSFVLLDFFKRYGHHLTYLHLFDLRVHPQQLYSALQQMPNLEALTLTAVKKDSRYDDKYASVANQYTPPCGKLTHLRIGDRTDHRILYDRVLQWFESQLKSFEYDGSDYKLKSSAFPNRNYEMEPNYMPFRQLERLKIFSAWEYFGFDSHDIIPFVSIKYFSFLILQPLVYQKLERLLKYLDKLAGTLVHLHLHVEIQYQLDRQVPLERTLVVFPNLKKFAITDDVESGLLRYFLMRFKKLETLQILNNFELRYNHDNLEEDELSERIVKRFEDENYWAICASLKTIEVHADTLGSENPLNFITIRRPELIIN